MPNNDDVWIDVEYLGASGSPARRRSPTTTKANVLASNAACTSDTSAWSGHGAAEQPLL